MKCICFNLDDDSVNIGIVVQSVDFTEKLDLSDVPKESKKNWTLKSKIPINWYEINEYFWNKTNNLFKEEIFKNVDCF
jgi:hypothetical protein